MEKERVRKLSWFSLCQVILVGLVVGMVVAFNAGKNMSYGVEMHIAEAQGPRLEGIPRETAEWQLAMSLGFAKTYGLPPISFVMFCFGVPVLAAGIALARRSGQGSVAETRVRGWQFAAFVVFWAGVCWGLSKGLILFPKAPLLPVGFYIGAGVYLAASILLVASAYIRRERWAHTALAAMIVGAAFIGVVKFKMPELIRMPPSPTSLTQPMPGMGAPPTR